MGEGIWVQGALTGPQSRWLEHHLLRAPGGRTGGLRLGSGCQGDHLLVADVVFPQGPYLGSPLLRAPFWSWGLSCRSPFNPDYLPKAPLLTATCWGWDFHRWIWGRDLGSWPPGRSCAHASGAQASRQPLFLS